MTWDCLACHKRHDDAKRQACPSCGEPRNLPKAEVPVRPRIFATASRSGGTPHILGVHRDRTVVCASCQAGIHGKKCWAADAWERHLRRRRDRDLAELLTVRDKVYDVLERHDEARNSDNLLFIHYFQDWYEVGPGVPWVDFILWIIREFGSGHLETIRRRRAELQSAGFFPACEEVRLDRFARARTFGEAFGRGVET